MASKKNPAAVALGKLRMANLSVSEREDLSRSGGLLGGAARARSLSAPERSAIAKKAAAARWGTKKKRPSAKKVNG